MQLVEIVEIHARFLLSLAMTNQYTVTTVSKNINQKEVTVVEADLVDAAVADMVEVETVDAEQADMAETAAVEADLEETDHQERCTRQPVQIVETNVKFHSNQTEKNQYTVTIALQTTNLQETTAEDISHFYTNYSFKNY